MVNRGATSRLHRRGGERGDSAKEGGETMLNRTVGRLDPKIAVALVLIIVSGSIHYGLGEDSVGEPGRNADGPQRSLLHCRNVVPGEAGRVGNGDRR